MALNNSGHGFAHEHGELQPAKYILIFNQKYNNIMIADYFYQVGGTF